MAQQVKDPASSLLLHGFDPWPKNCHVSPAGPKIREKNQGDKSKKKKKKTSESSLLLLPKTQAFVHGAMEMHGTPEPPPARGSSGSARLARPRATLATLGGESLRLQGQG